MQSLIYRRVIRTRRNILWQYGIPHDSVASISISPIHVPLKHNSKCIMLRDIDESPQQTTPAEIGGQRH
jgi:hypothetical protein